MTLFSNSAIFPLFLLKNFNFFRDRRDPLRSLCHSGRLPHWFVGKKASRFRKKFSSVDGTTSFIHARTFPPPRAFSFFFSFLLDNFVVFEVYKRPSFSQPDGFPPYFSYSALSRPPREGRIQDDPPPWWGRAPVGTRASSGGYGVLSFPLFSRSYYPQESHSSHLPPVPSSFIPQSTIAYFFRLSRAPLVANFL